MRRITKIAISLPEDVLEALEVESRLKGESRNEFFRCAADVLLKQRWERIASKEYVRGYQEIPESAEDDDEDYAAFAMSAEKVNLRA